MEKALKTIQRLTHVTEDRRAATRRFRFAFHPPRGDVRTALCNGEESVTLVLPICFLDGIAEYPAR